MSVMPGGDAAHGSECYIRTEAIARSSARPTQADVLLDFRRTSQRRRGNTGRRLYRLSLHPKVTSPTILCGESAQIR